MKDRNDRATPRPSISGNRADSRAGDEGLEENMSAARSRKDNERMQGSPSTSRSSNVRSDDVRDPTSMDRTTQRHSSSESSRSFEGQGGQKGGSRASEQGTGSTEERSDRLREDDSLSGSQGRQGKSGSRQGKQSSKNERASEQSEKSSRADVDRTLM